MAKSHEQKLKAVAEAEKKKDAEIEVSILIRKDCPITRLLRTKRFLTYKYVI